MFSTLPLTLVPLLFTAPVPSLFSSRSLGPARTRAGWLWLLQLSWLGQAANLDSTGIQSYPNGSTYVWTVEDTYQGQDFFDYFEFFTGPDPTNGQVNYTDRTTAFADGLAYVTPDNIVVMKGDNTTWLAEGENRKSVRISSYKQYNTGLFILDLDMAPWGCGVWPAWWTVGSGTWPYTGEIDIIEGVHDNEHNQVTWHTGPNCNLTENANFTGTIVETNGVPNLDCDGSINYNAGCGVVEWSRASYGPVFDEQGGGVFAMKWDVSGIGVWSFYRAAVPQDLTDGKPTPSTWGEPVAFLEPGKCNPITNFINHSIIFDITFCGDWAGNSYTTSGCPGTCPERLMDPGNFVNASWRINTLTVYRQQTLHGEVSTSAGSHAELHWLPALILATVVISHLA